MASPFSVQAVDLALVLDGVGAVVLGNGDIGLADTLNLKLPTDDTFGNLHGLESDVLGLAILVLGDIPPDL